MHQGGFCSETQGDPTLDFAWIQSLSALVRADQISATTLTPARCRSRRTTWSATARRSPAGRISGTDELATSCIPVCIRVDRCAGYRRNRLGRNVSFTFTARNVENEKIQERPQRKGAPRSFRPSASTLVEPPGLELLSRAPSAFISGMPFSLRDRSLPQRLVLIIALFGAVFAPVAAAASATSEENADKRWAQYEPSFKAFAEQDTARPPVKGGILFVGSSIFRQWTTVVGQLAPLPVLNRAFGGSRTGDQVARFDQLVPVYAPKVIVYYCGSNDLKAGPVPEDPAAIFARFREFSERARKFNPSIRLIFASSTRSPDRVGRWEQVDHYNALARAHCAATPGHVFVDLNPALVDSNGHPRLDLYKDDKLHFHPPAYVEFTRIIKPVLERVWREVEAKP